MNERRPPYTTRTLPRQPWPDETATRFEPPTPTINAEVKAWLESEIDMKNELREIATRQQAELDRLRQRLATVEAAARVVCGPHECIGLLFEAIEELGRVVGKKGGGL